MINCPVCPTENIPDDIKTCPGCGTDLSPILRVRELSRAFYQEAIELANKGATDIAIQKVLSSLGLNEQQVDARILLGKLYWKKGQFREAINNWTYVTALSPENQAAKTLLAKARQKSLTRSIRKWVGIIILFCSYGIILLGLIKINFDNHRRNIQLLASSKKTSDRLNVLAGQLDMLKQQFDQQENRLSSVINDTIKQQIHMQNESIAAFANSLQSFGEKIKVIDAKMQTILRSQDQSNKNVTLVVEDNTLIRDRVESITRSTDLKFTELNSKISSLKSLHLEQTGNLINLCEDLSRLFDDRIQQRQQRLKNELNHLESLQAKQRSQRFLFWGSSEHHGEETKKEQIKAELTIIQEEYEAVDRLIKKIIKEMKQLQVDENR